MYYGLVLLSVSFNQIDISGGDTIVAPPLDSFQFKADLSRLLSVLIDCSFVTFILISVVLKNHGLIAYWFNRLYFCCACRVAMSMSINADVSNQPEFGCWHGTDLRPRWWGLIHSHRNIRNQSNVNYQFYFLCCFRFDSMRLRQLNMNDAPLIIWVSDDVPVWFGKISLDCSIVVVFAWFATM